MTPTDGGSGVLVAIAVMAAATYAMRASGFWLMSQMPPHPRLRRMLEALPGSLVIATVLPMIVREGLSVALAVAAAIAVMLVWRKDLLAVITGMTVAAAVRAAGVL
jgi:branched chain amino acid efflux pump